MLLIFTQRPGQNLFNNYITRFLQPYKTIDKILQTEYGVHPDTNIRIWHTKHSTRPGFRNYRTKFRHYYLGPLSGLRRHMHDTAKARTKNNKLDRQSRTANRPIDERR
jgi:hypothetical protein